MNIRRARTAALAAVAVLAAAVALTPPPAAHAEEPDPGWTVTESGPLGPADRDLLVRVRLAGLWEAPPASRPRTGPAARRSRRSATTSVPSTSRWTPRCSRSRRNCRWRCPTGPMPSSRAGSTS
ncbi:hypothetical protein ACFQZ4_16635 [Catellatospora coxensis]